MSLKREDWEKIIQEENPASNAQTENPCMRTDRKETENRRAVAGRPCLD